MGDIGKSTANLDFLTVVNSGGELGNETLIVRGYGAADKYEKINKIVGFADDGCDVFELGSGVVSPASLD